MMPLTRRMKSKLRIPYALRHVAHDDFDQLLPAPDIPDVGDVVIAEITQIGKNAFLELANGRRGALYVGDLIAAVFGNRYATKQYEGYARIRNGHCDLLSMGGLCGLVESKHEAVAAPTQLRIVGAIGDQRGRPLNSTDHGLRPLGAVPKVHVAVVCGTSMDSGKTHTVMSTIRGLEGQGHQVAGVKLTGSATGRDTWHMLDAGACAALDFTDAGWPSTYLCTREQLLAVYQLLLAHARKAGADWVVVEIADGLLQVETAALLGSAEFRSTVDFFLCAAGEPMAAIGAVGLLRSWGIELLAVTGLVSMSSLNIREVEATTNLRCLTSVELRNGALQSLMEARTPSAPPLPRHPEATQQAFAT